METSLRFQRLEQFHCQATSITRIPANILIGPDKRVITQDIRGKELINKVRQLTEQDKEKEKSRQRGRTVLEREKRKIKECW